MSMYSGKCDLADWIDIRNDDDYILNKTVYYLGWHNFKNHVTLPIGSMRTLMQYFPYVIAASFSDNEHATVILQEESFVDIEEREHLGWILDDVLKYYRKCKRTKKEFKEDEAFEEYKRMNSMVAVWNEEQIKEIINRVKDDGEKTSIYGIHIPYFDSERKRLWDDMAEYDREHKDVQ